jgi:hypothetical protein
MNPEHPAEIKTPYFERPRWQDFTRSARHRGIDLTVQGGGNHDVELAVGAANIALLGLNMRDGLKMKGWFRRQPA